MNIKRKLIKDFNVKKESLINYYNDEIYKINYKMYDELPYKGKLILVTAMTPTIYGEGKTTVSIGLADAMNYIKKNVLLSLREPSLGPVFGTKGGAAGGGKCLLIPEDKINTRFTGDFDNVATVNNLISSVIDNEMYFNSNLNISSERIVFHRCMDVCDRFLKDLTFHMDRKKSPNIEYKSSFVITAASEIMAIFTLSQDENDFKSRLEDVTVAFSTDNRRITVKDLNITNALMSLMKETLYPNVVRTKYNTLSLVHAGPFANIATGTSSAISLKLALKLSDYVITECGFGADLGFEKYIDIVSRNNKIYPDLTILVVTIKAIKYHGDGNLELGFENVKKNIELIRKTNIEPIIAINKFNDDSSKDIRLVQELCEKNNIEYSFVTSYKDGNKGAVDLANKVVEKLQNKKQNNIKFFYNFEDTIENKIFAIAKNAYGCKDVEYSQKTLDDIKVINENGFSNFAICMAKTPNSFTDDKNVKNRGDNSTLHIQKIEFNSGSRLLIPYTGEMILMPGLSKDPLIKHFK